VLRSLSLLGFLVLVFPAFAAGPRRRAIAHPAPPLTRERVTELSVKIAERVVIPPFEPRLHWENVPYLDGTLLVAEQMERRSPGSGAALIERVAAVILGSGDNVNSIYWGDGTAFSQVVMDLYRLTPEGDPRRDALLGTLGGSMAFAEHAVRVSPDFGSPREPWWVEGGFGTRYWQDDMYMVIPWLAMNGSTRDGLPGNTRARDLAYEWIESYVYDHRPASSDPRQRAVPAARERNGFLLWDPDHSLFQHAPETIGSDEFWGRGNGWAVMGLARAAKYLDSPYGGGRYAAVVDATQIRTMLVRVAETLVEKRTPDGGWPSNLSKPLDCPIAETSATGLVTAFLAQGVNEGWLDRETYVPVILRAFSLLLNRIDRDGVVSGIQPPGTGPAFCSAQMLASNHPTINVNYGVGAVLLAAARILELPDEVF